MVVVVVVVVVVVFFFFFADTKLFMTKEKSSHTETSKDREIGNVF